MSCAPGCLLIFKRKLALGKNIFSFTEYLVRVLEEERFGITWIKSTRDEEYEWIYGSKQNCEDLSIMCQFSPESSIIEKSLNKQVDKQVN